MKKSYLGFLSLLSTSFIYGVFGIFVRYLNYYATGSQLTLLRSFIVALVVLLILFYRKLSPLNVPRKFLLHIFFLSFTFGATIFLFTYAVLTTTLAKATFSFYSTTLITSLIASIFIFKEGFSIKKRLSFILAMFGVILFVYPSGIQAIDIGMSFTAIAGISDVITNSMKKTLSGKVDRFILVFYQMLAGIVVGITLLIGYREYTLLHSFTPEAVGMLLFFSLNFFLLSYLTIYGFQHFDLNLGTIVLSLEFVFASLAGYFLYHEQLSFYQIIASISLIVSIIMINFPAKKSSPQTSSKIKSKL